MAGISVGVVPSSATVERPQFCHSHSVDSDEDKFCDALEEQPVPCSMDLVAALKDTQMALNLFLNNKFDIAKKMMEHWASSSMYHALGNATILHVEAIMTFEAELIAQALDAVKQAAAVANRHRKVAITRVFPIPASPLQEYSDEEMHAELCYAESLLMQAMLSFVQDESLVSFVKGAMKIRACYLSYRECSRILRDHMWSSRDDVLREHFEAGVRIGIGAFNLLISLLPAKILKLLEFVGFTGDRTTGLVQLQNVAGGLEHTLRAPFASMALLTFHTIVEYVLGLGDCDIAGCERLSQPLLKNYPNGSIVLFFAGRLAVVSGEIDKVGVAVFLSFFDQKTDYFYVAVVYLNRSITAQSEYRLFHHFCYWELMFCHAFERRWIQAADFAYKLYSENKWSPATYAYLTATFLHAAGPHNLTAAQRDRMDSLFRKAPGLKQRIAGKSVPVEKYCIAKANLYISNSTALVLAHFEVLYLWNGFQILGKNQRLLKPIFDDIDGILSGGSNDGVPLCQNDVGLSLLLKALCLRHFGDVGEAEQMLKALCGMEKSLPKDSHVIPSAYLELALLALAQGEADNAKQLAAKVRSRHGYLMEHRVLFKLHALQRLLI